MQFPKLDVAPQPKFLVFGEVKAASATQSPAGAFFKSRCEISGVAFQRFLRTLRATY